MVVTNYRYKGQTLPKCKQKSIDDYIQKGTDPGHFLSACLANNLIGAYNYADDWGRELIPVIAAYIHNRVPMVCIGSKDAVDNWKDIGGMDGMEYDEENKCMRSAKFINLSFCEK